jgi:hypothetical protein
MTSRVLAGRLLTFTGFLFLATLAAAQTTTEKRGTTTVTTSQLKGEVAQVEGNSLVVKMSDGEVRTFNVPESRRFIIDGKELTVHELQPGTMLTATVTTQATPVTLTTTTVKTGTVWYVQRNNVIFRLPNGENKQYIVKDDTKFTVNGNPATVADLRKGMVVHAERVTEVPMMDIASNTTVVGQAPAPAAAKPEAAPAVAQTAPSEAAPAPAEAQTPPPAEAQTPTPTPTPAPAPVSAPETSTPPEASGGIPKGLVWGLVLVAAALAVWMLVRRKS